MHARQRGPVRTILVSLLVAAVALVPLPGHAAEPVRASCEFPAGGLFMMEGDSLPAEVAFTNDSDHAVVFRVVMRENFHYGPEHVVLSHVLGEGRAHQAEIDLGPAYGLGLGPADIVLDVETSDTGETAIATCTVTVRVLPLPDSDGDGLPDEWETKGIDYDKDGDVDFALHEEAVDPERKDVFVELDAMLCDRSDPATSFCRRPRTISPEAVGRAQWEFAEQGIALHVDRDVDPVSEIRFLRFDTKGPGGLDDFDDLKIGYPERPCDGTFGTRADRESSNCENILGAKRLVYHYGILAHALADRGTTSGYAETGDDSAATVADALRAGTALPGGNDFVITLGAWTDEMIARNGGLSAVQAGVFLHELGHNLGLQHGGADPINCKPHYLSVMNYLYQFPANLSQRTPDFQDEERGTLNEKGGLDETVAAVPGTENEVEPKSVVYGVGGVRHSGYADAAADWNGDGQYQTGVTADINHVRLGEDTTSCPASPDQTLSAWNDWEHARYNFRQSRMFADGAHKGASGAAGDEITGEAALSLNSPIDLAVTATVDKAEAGAGDTLTYTATATNKGPAAARRVALTGTPPDGPAVNRPLPDLAAGAEATETFTYTIPCGTPDAATLTGKVQVTGTNEYGSPSRARSATTPPRPPPRCAARSWR
ncbi:CARDB domain-containing protein [Thermocatellispora tengchongensis]|uniref:CARDB domain-containing protein n=1 Tax=Thermocatellispora tengchongensis TaxID=1073253 RepID=UPI0036279CE4